MQTLPEIAEKHIAPLWIEEAVERVKKNGYGYERFIAESVSETNVEDGVNDIFANLMDVLVEMSVETHKSMLRMRRPEGRQKCEKIIAAIGVLSEVCYQLSIDGIPLVPDRRSALEMNQAGDNVEVFRATGANIGGIHCREVYIMVRPHRFVNKNSQRFEDSKQPRFSLGIEDGASVPRITFRIDLDKERVDRSLVRSLRDLAGRGITFDILFQDQIGVNLLDSFEELGVGVQSRRHGHHFNCDMIEGMDVTGGFQFSDILTAIASKIKEACKEKVA